MAQGTDIGIQQVILHLSEARKVVGAEISECAGQLGQLGRVRALTALGESIEALLRQAEQTSNEKLRATGLSKEQPQRLPKQAKDEYPKFFIRGDLLVKRGLSRGGKKTYEHSVPKATVEAVIGLLAQEAKHSIRFTPQSLVEKALCLSYQFYVVLAWLAHLRIVERQRRGEYRFVSQSTFESDAQAGWYEG